MLTFKNYSLYLYIVSIYYEDRIIKRAQKKYFDKKLKEGWISIKLFIPSEIKEKIMKCKKELMKEYYGGIPITTENFILQAKKIQEKSMIIPK